MLDEDITKGYQIVATGEIDYDGNVHPIGGIDKKSLQPMMQGLTFFLLLTKVEKKALTMK